MFQRYFSILFSLTVVAILSGCASPTQKRDGAAEVSEKELADWVNYFASPAMKGRMTGGESEKVYTAKIKEKFLQWGLEPVGEDLILPFQFQSSGKIQKARLEMDGKVIGEKDWRPLSFSRNTLKKMQKTDIVFAGYGLKVPKGEGFEAYDSFKGLDVKGKWIAVFRFIPESLKGKKRIYFQRYSRLQFKAKTSAQLGAKGVLIISGPNSGVKKSLVPWSGESSARSEIPILSISDKLAEELMGRSLKKYQSQLDVFKKSRPIMVSRKLGLEIQIEQKLKKALNVVGRVAVPGAQSAIVIGAHGDHLGENEIVSSSRASSDSKEKIHFGADDNASGMASVMELAQYFSQPENRKDLKHDIYFAIWSGEELGTIGSQDFVKKHLSGKKVKAYVNLDMVGRLEKALQVQGIGSGKGWQEMVQPHAEREGLKVEFQQDPYLPTDSTSFYLAEIPTVAFFTGTHDDYHSPADTAEKINFKGLFQVTRLAKNVVRELAVESSLITYVKVKRQQKKAHGRRSFRIYLGTLPNYGFRGKGLKLSGVIKGGPAEKGGLKKGDLVLKLGSKEIATIYDYMYILEMSQPGVELAAKVKRDGKVIDLKIIPESKQ